MSNLWQHSATFGSRALNRDRFFPRWEDTLLVFTSDNGGPLLEDENAATNFPLRGGKSGDRCDCSPSKNARSDRVLYVHYSVKRLQCTPFITDE